MTYCVLNFDFKFSRSIDRVDLSLKIWKGNLVLIDLGLCHPFGFLMRDEGWMMVINFDAMCG